MKGYICPICKRKLFTEESIKKHSLACWREAEPNHIVKHAPQGETISTRTVNNDVVNFFNSFAKGTQK